MANPAESEVQNLLPVQAYFDAQGNFQTFIGQNKPFYATLDPQQSGLQITNSTINSSVIGGVTPAAASFTTATVLTQPVGATDVVNLLALQSYAAGISWKQPCVCATLANITLSGLQTIDGHTVVAGNRVLVKDQSTAANNGIYIASASAWSRSSDADTWNELICAISFIEYGTQAGGAWFCTAQDGGTLGVTAINWSQFTTSATYSAGTGLTLTGQIFSITPVGTASTYGSASTVPVFTTNASGQVSAVTNTNITIAATQITSGTIDSARLSGSYSGITGLGTLTDLTVTNAIVGSITGNAATATTAGSATTATTATNLAGGATGSLPYQTASSITGFLAAGTNGQILALASGVPSWIDNQVGTVTSVSGTGTVSGISLSGTVTSSGSLTLGGTLDLSSPPAIGATSPNTAKFSTALIGSGANFTDYPNAQLVSTQSKISGYGHAYRIGLVGEAQANSSDANIWGVGVYGKAWTNGATRCAGIEGDAGVTNTADTGTATAVRAYSNSTHAGGRNIGMTVSASGSSVGNYAIYMQNGDLFSAAAQSWELVDNSNSALRINTAGKTGILDIITTNGSEGIATSGNLNVVGTVALNGSTGTSGYVMTSNGALAPTWSALPASGITITDDTTTNATRYLAFTSATSGSITGQNVSSTKLQFNPSTGAFTATSLTPTNALGATYGGTGLTSPGTSGNVLTSNGTAWVSSTLSVTPTAVSDQANTSTGYFDLPSGTTAQRPGTPATGMIRFNSTESKYEVYTGAEWQFINTSAYPIPVDFLLVAGGAGGGFNFHTITSGGGGGAGGYRSFTGQSILAATSYTVTIGAGGAGSPNTSTNGGVGSNSVFSTFTSAGGGYGATNQQAGGAGGSGGGASGPTTPGSFAGGVGNTPSTSPSQGNNGGLSNQYGGGGGGGSSGAGANSSTGTGGAGTANSISGSSVTYAEGGGGSGAAGTANTGNGGSRGNGGANNPGFAGGSGVFIIKYPNTFTLSNPGGGLTSSTSSAGGFKVTTFTAGTGNIQLN